MRRNDLHRPSELVEITDAELDAVVGADKGGIPGWVDNGKSPAHTNEYYNFQNTGLIQLAPGSRIIVG